MKKQLLLTLALAVISTTSALAANKSILFANQPTGDNGNYVRVPNSSSLAINGPEVTIEAWVLFTGSNAQVFLGETESGSNTYLILNGSGRWVTSINESFVTTSAVPQVGGVWQHVALTYSAQARRFYVNGNLVSDTPGGGSISATDDIFFSGRASASQYLNGQLDEVRIWNRARTQAEIQANMNKTLSGAESGLVGYWTFDALDASGHVPDRSGHGNDGIIMGSAQLVDSTAPIGTVNTYTLTASAGANGTISPSGSVSVSQGGSQAFTITANTGYRVSDVLVDGSSVGAVSSYAFSNVTANHTISASFAANSTNMAIDFSADVGSYVQVPLSNSLQINGTEITLEAWIAFSGNNGQFYLGSDYAMQNQSLTGAGAWQYSTKLVGSYQSTPPTGGTPVLGGVWQHIAFTGSINGGRKFYVNGVQTTGFNESYGTIQAAKDFFIGGGSFVDGGPGQNEYLNGQLEEVRVWNRALSQTELQTNMNKTLVGSESGLVGYWAFDALDASGRVPDKSGHGNDGVIVGHPRLVNSTAPISVTNVTSYTVTASAGSNGSISPSGSVSVNQGGSQTFTITGNTGYHVSDVLVDGSSVGAVSSYTFSNVTGNHSISASFAVNTYTLTASAGANGTITPSGATTVNYGGSQAFTITANTGYHIADVLVDGSSVGAVSSYTFSNVTVNHTISASFVVDASPPAQTISTVAGNGTGTFSGDGGAATNAGLSATGAAVDGAGNIYIATWSNNRIRKVNTSTGMISTVAGNGANGYSGDGGAATSAALAGPIDVAVDGAGNVYIADHNNCRIRKISALTGTISTIAGTGTFGFSGDGGLATNAQLSNPVGVAVDGAGNVYIADRANNRIRKVNVSTGSISTVAGNGIAGFSGDGGAATSAALSYPWGVGVSSTGDVYIADSANNRIRKVNASTGSISTIAGTGGGGFSGDGGAGTSAAVSYPLSVDVDGAGNVYIADYGNNRIRKVDALTGIISTVAGTGTTGFSGDGGAATIAQLGSPWGVAIDGVGNVYIADTGNNRIRKVASGVASYTYTLMASSGNNGSISPSGSVSVSQGGSQAFTITADTGYRVSDVLVDGSSVGAVNSYTFSNVTANHTISASFAANINTYTVTASAGSNGSISPSGSVSVSQGGSQTFTITGNTGYHVSDVLVDGSSVGAANSYTFSNVTANHTIAASFAINTYTFTASAGANGAISPSGSVSVNQGANQTFTITPNTGYHIADVLVDGGSVGAVSSYTFSNVIANHTIAASFAINTYTLTASAGTNGTISPVGAISVTFGGSQSFTITPNTDYRILAVVVDGSSVGAVSNYTFNSVAVNHTIAASFAINLPMVNVPGPQTVDEGKLLTFAVGATDPATGQTLTVTATGLPAGAVFTAGTFTWRPAYDQAGSYTVTFKATKGSLSTQQTVSISVRDIPLPINEVVAGAIPQQYWWQVGSTWYVWVSNGGRNEIRDSAWNGYALKWPFYYQNSSYNAVNGETRPAIGDLDGNGFGEIVLGAGRGSYGWVQISSSSWGRWLNIPWTAYNNYNGETRPAVGDLDGDGKAETVVGLGTGGGGWLAVFGSAAEGYRFKQWLGSGINLETRPAVGDLDGDGRAEIVVGYGSGGGGYLLILGNASEGYAFKQWLQIPWSAYNYYYGETRPAIGDLDEDGRAEIVVGLGQYAGGYAMVFRFDPAQARYVPSQWLGAGGTSWPAVGDVDRDGKADVLFGIEGSSAISVFKGGSTLSFDRWINTAQQSPTPAVSNILP